MILKNSLNKLIATCFYFGYAPYAPGTFGSLFGLGIYFLTRANPILYFSATIIVTILGFVASEGAEKIFGYKDAQKIVIDEASGMLISLMFVPYNIWNMWLCFFLFRLFDVIKPYPLRNLQKLQCSWGVMLDDIGAAIYTNICVQVFLRLAVNSAS